MSKIVLHSAYCIRCESTEAEWPQGMGCAPCSLGKAGVRESSTRYNFLFSPSWLQLLVRVLTELRPHPPKSISEIWKLRKEEVYFSLHFWISAHHWGKLVRKSSRNHKLGLLMPGLLSSLSYIWVLCIYGWYCPQWAGPSRIHHRAR